MKQQEYRPTTTGDHIGIGIIVFLMVIGLITIISNSFKFVFWLSDLEDRTRNLEEAQKIDDLMRHAPPLSKPSYE